MAALGYRLLPLLVAFIAPKHGYFCPVSTKLVERYVVELENVIDYLFFRYVDGAVFAADVNHKAYLLLGNFFLFGFGTYAQKPEYTVR